MITAQELRDMGNTLSWEDYTIGTIEQQVKAQQDRKLARALMEAVVKTCVTTAYGI